jgi:hypothetical protein
MGRLTTGRCAEVTDDLIRFWIKGDDRDGRGQGLRKEVPEGSFQSVSWVFKAIVFEKIISQESGSDLIPLCL